VTGKFVTFTLIARNNGPEAARDVVITDVLPSNVRHIYSFATRGNPRYDTSAHRVTLRLGRMGRGDSVRIAITAFRKSRDAMVNTAIIESSTPDPNPSNNSSTVTVGGSGAPSAQIEAASLEGA
jgi:uncharacterized repeat protein (TIGR01451 family)